jgi:quercetin dioxygenase-like cupin family protein
MKRVTKGFLLCIFTLFISNQVLAENFQWQQMKDLPPGAEVALISGDPVKAGTFTLRLKLPAHYIVPAHSHPTQARATIMSGTYYVGTGEVADANTGKALHKGNSFIIPANSKHYGWTKNGTVLQIEATGPWDMVYAANG